MDTSNDNGGNGCLNNNPNNNGGKGCLDNDEIMKNWILNRLTASQDILEITPDEKLVEAMIYLGSTIIETLKRNAYMLSAMTKNQNNKGINKYVALLVKPRVDMENVYQLRDPIKQLNQKFLISDAFRTKIPKKKYNSVWEKVAEDSGNQVSAENHPYKMAIDYMRVWANFVAWSCDYECSTTMTVEKVNGLLAMTEKN